MTDNEIKLKELEERVKRLENKVFDMWIDQYETDISEEPYDWDPEPWVPLHAASQEMVERAMQEHREWEERQKIRNSFKGKFTIN